MLLQLSGLCYIMQDNQCNISSGAVIAQASFYTPEPLQRLITRIYSASSHHLSAAGLEFKCIFNVESETFFKDQKQINCVATQQTIRFALLYGFIQKSLKYWSMRANSVLSVLIYMFARAQTHHLIQTGLISVGIIYAALFAHSPAGNHSNSKGGLWLGGWVWVQ